MPAGSTLFPAEANTDGQPQQQTTPAPHSLPPHLVQPALEMPQLVAPAPQQHPAACQEPSPQLLIRQQQSPAPMLRQQQPCAPASQPPPSPSTVQALLPAQHPQQLLVPPSPRVFQSQ